MKKFSLLSLMAILASTLTYAHSISKTTFVAQTSNELTELNVNLKQLTMLQISSSGTLRINKP